MSSARITRALIAALAALALATSACSGSEDGAATTDIESAATTAPATTAAESGPDDTAADAATFFPNVVAADATQANDGTWTFSVTLSSPYDSPAQYADAWRVVDADRTELGFRLLTHDHATEQPFTRAQSGIEIPDGVTTVTIEGRDQANGWGGDFLELDLPS